jgi:arylsulfatase A-like enzyme
LESNTVVVFTAATGPGPGGDTRHFRGEAGTLLEGGLRVPFLARWPGVIKAGRAVSPVLHTTDVLPTLGAAAGLKVAAPAFGEGINFLDYLKGGVPAPVRPVLVWSQAPNLTAYERHGIKAPYPDEAVLLERWKVLFAAGQPVAVFNIFTDSGERFDRLHDPKESRALEKVPPALEAWRARLRASDTGK